MKCLEGKQSSRISKTGAFPDVCIFALTRVGTGTGFAVASVANRSRHYEGVRFFLWSKSMHLC